MFGLHLAFAGDQPITTAFRGQPLNGDPLAHISTHVPREALQVRHDLCLGHEPLGLVAVVGEVRQAALPVGGDQAERIPALLIPGVSDAVLFQHHRTDAPLLQLIGHRKSGLTGSDHHNRMIGLESGAIMHAVQHQSAHDLQT